VRGSWTRAARLRGEAVLHGAGYDVRAVGGPSSDVVPVDVEDIRFGLSGRVSELQLRTYAGAPRAEARTEVAWELLDLARGAAIFGRTHQGQARGAVRAEDAVALALDDALARLVADSLFRRALVALPGLTSVGPGAFAAVEPVAGEPIPLEAADLNPTLDSGAVERVLAGVVTLRGADQIYGTAFMLTKGGLALATHRAVRQSRRLRARLPSGVVRPVRVLRAHAGLDVALIQVSCPDPCTTVDWEVVAPDVNVAVVTVGAPASDVAPPFVARGRLGGQWGIAHGVTLETQGDEVVLGGEPVAIAGTGKVVGMVSSRPGRRTALLLGEILRVLRVVPP